MCDRAMALNLYAYTVTDHCECHEYLCSSQGFSYKEHSQNAFTAMQSKQAELQGKLHFYKGIELGQPMQNLAAAEEVLQRPYDFVLGSVHNIRYHEDFYYLDYSHMSAEELDGILIAYFDEMLEMLHWGNIDSLAHLTYPLRYIEGSHGMKVDLTRYHAKLQEIFSLLIEKQIALEINTSGLRQAIGRTLPDLPLLKQYYDRGGRLVTVGSDAHKAEDIAKGIAEGFTILQQAGFSAFAVYENHKPILLPLK